MASLRILSRQFNGFGKRRFNSLVVAAHDGKTLAAGTKQAVAAASKIVGSTDLHVLVAGQSCDAVATEAANIAGVSKVILAESDQLSKPVADTMSELVLALQKANGYKVLAGDTSSSARDILPRVAANLDVQPVTDVIAVLEEAGVYERPMYAGNAISTVKTKDDVQILTFRPTAFEAAGDAASPAPVEKFATESYTSTGINFVTESEKSGDDKPQLGSANRVVSGGRGLANGENFDKVLNPLCDALGAAMGASRAAVDAGFVPNEMQVGQTGKVVAPELYVAVGISGAIQHLAGMKDSKTIVAINKDADAPIFSIADHGLVADLFEAVPELTKKVA
jgi:electron transfer flavoprotein alpha subunit